MVKRKAAGRKIEQPGLAEDGGKVIDLMEALRGSVHGNRGRKTPVSGKKKKPARNSKAA